MKSFILKFSTGAFFIWNTYITIFHRGMQIRRFRHLFEAWFVIWRLFVNQWTIMGCWISIAIVFNNRMILLLMIVRIQLKQFYEGFPVTYCLWKKICWNIFKEITIMKIFTQYMYIYNFFFNLLVLFLSQLKDKVQIFTHFTEKLKISKTEYHGGHFSPFLLLFQ